MQSIKLLELSASRVQPLIDSLSMNDSNADEITWEIKTAALNVFRGLECGRSITKLCGRCEWVCDQTELRIGVCDWIEQQQQAPANELEV